MSLPNVSQPLLTLFATNKNKQTNEKLFLPEMKKPFNITASPQEQKLNITVHQTIPFLKSRMLFAPSTARRHQDLL